MSSTQNLLPWLSAHIFYLISAVLLLYLAYVFFKEIFRRRNFPSQVDRRVDNVVLTESGTRKIFTESGTRPAGAASGTRAAASSSEDQTP
jgi:hypothetical protein